MHHDHDRDDQADRRDPEPAPLQDKEEPDPRPDEPTTSEGATLAERGEGAHAEYAEAPETMRDNPPPEDEGASGGHEDGHDDH